MTSNSALPVVQSNFSQQGTLDWVALAETAVSFSVGVLSRLSAAGIDPYTIVVGQMIAKDFPLSHQGLQNIRTAISQTRHFAGFGDALWFGFGVKSFISTLTATDEGKCLLALSATLSECFDEAFAAETIHHITLSYKAPGSLTPSVNEWLNVVRACSGALSATKFPVLAEGFMRLDLNVIKLFEINDNSHTFVGRGFPSAEDLARTICGIGKVASGELDSVTVTGCSAVGWVAAISDWLFGLRIVIRSGDGRVLYSNCPSGREPQVQFEFGSAGVAHGASTEIVAKSYRLQDYTKLFGEKPPGIGLVSGRVAWEDCLQQTFGLDFQLLMETPMNMGTLIGCAARMLQAIVLAEPGFRYSARKQYRSYFRDAYGQGMVSSIVLLFPEIKSLRTHMEKGVRMSLTEATAQYEERYASIRRLCNCSVCGTGKIRAGFCATLIVEVILVLTLLLSGITFGDLCPVRRGIEIFYQHQYRLRRNSLAECMVKETGPLAWVLESTACDHNAHSVEGDRRLLDAVRLFTGHVAQTSASNVSALAHNGICVYLDVLRALSIDPDLNGRVNVVPGCIERDSKPFYTIKDRSLSDREYPDLQEGSYDIKNVALSVTETVSCLEVWYVLHYGPGKQGQTIHSGPAGFINKVSEARGLVFCEDNECDSVVKDLEKLTSDLASNKLGTAHCSWDQQIYVHAGHGYDDKSIIAAITLGWKDARNYDTLIADGECIHCCVKKAMEVNWSPMLIVLSERGGLETGIVQQSIESSAG